jgi:GT2 family glycosyltransferase
MSLTIVYSTRPQAEKKSSFIQHLQQTCGLKPVEILAYTNPGTQSLSEIYNHALNQARHPFIVFIHDDIIFETLAWGTKIIHSLQNTDYGILGIAGTAQLPASGIWWQEPLTTIGIVQHQDQSRQWTSNYSGRFAPEQIIPAVCVDGVFLTVNRDRLQRDFNEGLTGFHFYDIDFCLANLSAGVKVGVVFNISLIHKSIGPTDATWEAQRQQFLATHQYHLPYTLKCSLILDNTPIKLKKTPKVTVVILHKTKNFLLFNCINSFAEKTTYPNYEIIVADTGSTPQQLAAIHQLAHTSKIPLTIVEFADYHFARINNEVVFHHTTADSQLILFCNNDIELINDALTRMVQVYLQNQAQCGTIGCRLHFADNTVQHAGIQLTLNQGQLEITHRGFHSYYHFEPTSINQVLGSTAAFLLMPRALFIQLGGFNTAYQKCLEDVELNLTCLNNHKKNYWVGNAVCYHFESQTRTEKRAITPQDYQRLNDFYQDCL